MDEQPFALAAIRNRLQVLPLLKLIAFSATCCECLMPRYTAFAKRLHCGDVAPLRMALDQVWDQMGGKSISRLDYEVLAKRCSEVAPDPEGFPEPDRGYAVRAREAADAIRETFDGSSQRSREKAWRAARLALDAVALRRYVPGTGQRRGASVIHNDPQAARELRNHLDVITVLETVETLSRSFLVGLRASVYIEEDRGTVSQREKGRAKPTC